MPFRTIEVLRSWIAELQATHGTSGLRVIPQDADAGTDTGLVAMKIQNSPTEIYLEPPAVAGGQWMITFEPREDYVRLTSTEVRDIAAEVATLADVCAFLQHKSDHFVSGADTPPKSR